ncbi:MAG: hypothetical protein NC187_02730 [Candidatus Amulumruptor caecigallinarius]|nr:hypothetical protein [Candidatus Amulumruptor caecigallinarius]MCM1396390.1 hypothetical protein [Candidatus Amulumruptor caecigallinarius]MCM1453553.1 hypothetical protein [bacterium]
MIVLAIILLVLEALYIPLARRMRIGAPVTPRSSATHTSYTATGGGIIFIIAALLYTYAGRGSLPPHFQGILAGGVVLAIISLTDDIREVRPGVRLVVQALIVGAAYFWLVRWPDVYLLTLIVGVGFINAYNFMDGISGMLAAYSVVTLGALLTAMHLGGAGASPEAKLAEALLTAAVVFGIFNFRRHAKVFCGDVGSIVMGYFILYLMLRVMLWRHDASAIVFVMVYGVDTVLTIFGRLFRGENILAPHRSHLYQRLANEGGVPHLTVALSYALLQGVIDAGFLLLPVPLHWTYTILVTAALVAAYFMVKPRVKGA